MFKSIRNLLLASPAAIGFVLGSQVDVFAQTNTDSNSGLLNQINNYSQEGNRNSRSQVTNVNQLRDVAPTDWAYEALRSLVDRYGCISGFPNQTYRGNQPLSRYEFAAGLNSCLNQIERLIASQDSGVAAEDLDTVNRLSQEFEAELVALNGRVDEIESRTAVLEDNQFSTTTKLEGEAVFGISGEFNSTDNDEIVFQDRVRLAFVSSFFGEDALYTRLDASNAGFGFQTNDANGDPIDLDTGALTYQTSDSGNDVGIGWLAYYFPIGEKINVYLPAAFPLWVDFVPSLSPYLDSFTGATGSLSSFAESSPIYKIGLASGGGAGFNFEANDFITVSAGYFGGDSFNPASDLTNDGGVFNDEYSALGQVTVSLLDDRLQLAGTYVYGKFGNGEFGGPPVLDDNGEDTREASNGIYDLGVGTSLAISPFGDSAEVSANSYGAAAAFQLNDRIALNAFGMFTDAIVTDGSDDAEIWSYGAGLSLPDLGKEGNLGAVFAGVQPYADGQSNPIHFEGLYKYQFNDNISVTPGVIYLINPNGNDEDDDAILGVVRTTFTF